MSDEEQRSRYQQRLAEVRADGDVSLNDQFLLIHQALDPHHYYERMRRGDPELLGLLKENPQFTETIKLVLSELDAAKKAVMSIWDDMNARRKEYADKLSRVA